jgi:beta-lactamase class A
MASRWAGVGSRLAQVPDVQWSIRVLDTATGADLFAEEPERMLPTASVGKLLLLVEVARRIESGDWAPETPLPRNPEDAVADSGLWQHLTAAELSVHDLATLVGVMSDNEATNVLLRATGLGSVGEVADKLGLERTRLNDRVRDQRTDQHPWTLSVGTAGELARLMADLGDGTVLSREVSARVLGWLKAGADLSMVAQPLGLDPLAHADGDRGVRLWHKTGTDDGTRADVGLVRAGDSSVAYAVVARWEPGGADRRDEVLSVMHAVGAALRDELAPAVH